MIPSLTLEYSESENLTGKLEALQINGFQAVNIGTPQCSHLICSSLAEVRSLMKLIHTFDLVVDWVHAPYRNTVLYDKENEYFNLSVGALKTAVIIASELEARSLVIHPFNHNFPQDVDYGSRVEQMVETLSVLVDYGRVLGVEIAIENIDEPFSYNLLEPLFKKLPDLKFCFDTGHAEVWNTWEKYLPTFTDRISALHIHDNHGEKDEHLIPGDGEIDFVPFLKQLKTHGYNGYLGLECVQKISRYPGEYHELADTIRKRIHSIFTQV